MTLHSVLTNEIVRSAILCSTCLTTVKSARVCVPFLSWLLGDIVAKVHKPKKLDSVHQIVSSCETVGSGDETNPKDWRLKHLQGKFRSPEVEMLLQVHGEVEST